MPKITLPTCFLTSGSIYTPIPPGTHTAKHHVALWSKKHPSFLHAEGKRRGQSKKRRVWRDEEAEFAQVMEEDSTTDERGEWKDYPLWRQERIREAAPCTAPFCHCWTVLRDLPDINLSDNLATPPGSPRVQDSSLGHGTNDTDGSQGFPEPTML